MYNCSVKTWKEKYQNGILLALLTFVFMLIFNRSSSPINLVAGYDEAIFKLFGLAIVDGRVPLRDYADRKGPYLFFINAIPYLTHTYRLGLFLIQFVCTYITSLLVFRMIKTIVAQKTAFLSLVGMYAFYAIWYSEGNACESYALLFITLSLYLCWSFVRQKKNMAEHPFSYTFVYGISFSIIAFIRLNDTATICGIVLACAYLLIREKKFAVLCAHVGVFLGGAIFAALPVILYYVFNHALGDMIRWTFVEGFFYNTFSSKDMVIAYTLRLFPLMPVFITVYLAQKYDKANDTHALPFALAIAVLLYLTIGTKNSAHYFIVTLPFYAVAIAYLLTARNMIALLLILCHFFSKYSCDISTGSRDNGFLFTMRTSLKELAGYSFMCNYNKQMREMYLSIPEEYRDNVFAYNIGHGMSFYVENKTLPPNKWFVLTTDSERDAVKKARLHENDSLQSTSTVRYVLYETGKDWADTGASLIPGYHEVSCIDARKHPRHAFMLHLLEKE